MVLLLALVRAPFGCPDLDTGACYCSAAGIGGHAEPRRSTWSSRASPIRSRARSPACPAASPTWDRRWGTAPRPAPSLVAVKMPAGKPFRRRDHHHAGPSPLIGLFISVLIPPRPRSGRRAEAAPAPSRDNAPTARREPPRRQACSPHLRRSDLPSCVIRTWLTQNAPGACDRQVSVTIPLETRLRKSGCQPGWWKTPSSSKMRYGRGWRPVPWPASTCRNRSFRPRIPVARTRDHSTVVRSGTNRFFPQAPSRRCGAHFAG